MPKPDLLKVEMPALEDGWHLVCDPSGAEAAMDPCGAAHWFILVRNGRIVEETTKEQGFGHGAKAALGSRLKGQLKALTRPTLFYERKIKDTYTPGKQVNGPKVPEDERAG